MSSLSLILSISLSNIYILLYISLFHFLADLHHYNSQIWIGTNFGTVIVYNCTGLINTNANANSNNLGDCTSCQTNLPNSTNNLRSTNLAPTGTVHTLKGQILSIVFLDSNGNVYDDYNSLVKDKNKVSNTNSLAIDYSYMPSTSILSNSIADNFYASSPSNTNSLTNNNNNSSVANANLSNNSDSSSSPTLASGPGSSYVNPFEKMADPKFEEQKGNQLPLSKIKSK